MEIPTKISLKFNFCVMPATAWRRHQTVTKLHHALTEAQDDNFCTRLHTCRPKMAVYRSAFGITPFICDSWALAMHSPSSPPNCVCEGCPLSCRVRSFVRLFIYKSVRLVKYCYHDTSWTALTIFITLTGIGNIQWPLLIRFWRSEVTGQGHSRPSKLQRHPRPRWSIEVHLLN